MSFRRDAHSSHAHFGAAFEWLNVSERVTESALQEETELASDDILISSGGLDSSKSSGRGVVAERLVDCGSHSKAGGIVSYAGHGDYKKRRTPQDIVRDVESIFGITSSSNVHPRPNLLSFFHCKSLAQHFLRRSRRRSPSPAKLFLHCLRVPLTLLASRRAQPDTRSRPDSSKDSLSVQ